MSLVGQNLDPERYAVVPRTISFPIHDDEILLMKVGPTKGKWAGLLNGIGGHVEPGESSLTAAVRELQEETGLLIPNQRLSGVVTVDTGTNPGIGLFVFIAEAEPRPLIPSAEGDPVWLPLASLSDYDLVEDLEFLVRRAVKSFREPAVFFASYSYAADGELRISSA